MLDRAAAAREMLGRISKDARAMTTSRRAALVLPAALLAAPALAQPAPASANWAPTRTVRIVVPIAPGGANDIIARLLGERLTPILGQTVIVENRPGAGGNIGAQSVLQAEKDGHTFLLTSANVLTANTFLYGNRMPFNAVRDFAPVTRVGTGTLLWVVNAQRPYRDFAAQIAFAKANPGRITMGSSGTGTISHLYFEKVKRATGTDMTHVPYRGGGPAIQDLISGNIDMMFDVMPALLPHVREGACAPWPSARRSGWTTCRRSPACRHGGAAARRGDRRAELVVHRRRDGHAAGRHHRHEPGGGAGAGAAGGARAPARPDRGADGGRDAGSLRRLLADAGADLAGAGDRLRGDRGVTPSSEWMRCTAAEVQAAAGRDALVIVPVASLEQHGPHLCTGTDILLGGTVALEVARRLREAGHEAIVTPVVWTGLAEHHMAFGGT
jgi:tripartite-type tricarboxylate transporter receptor subunit TctC